MSIPANSTVRPVDPVSWVYGPGDVLLGSINSLGEYVPFGSSFPQDVEGNYLVNFIPRSGTENALLALAGIPNEVAVSTDTKNIVIYNGVANQGKVIFQPEEKVLYHTVTDANAATIIDCRNFQKIILVPDDVLLTSVVTALVRMPLFTTTNKFTIVVNDKGGTGNLGNVLISYQPEDVTDGRNEYASLPFESVANTIEPSGFFDEISLFFDMQDFKWARVAPLDLGTKPPTVNMSAGFIGEQVTQNTNVNTGRVMTSGVVLVESMTLPQGIWLVEARVSALKSTHASIAAEVSIVRTSLGVSAATSATSGNERGFTRKPLTLPITNTYDLGPSSGVFIIDSTPLTVNMTCTATFSAGSVNWLSSIRRTRIA
jgi:hypothetical protein